jgi:hypothetical protein
MSLVVAQHACAVSTLSRAPLALAAAPNEQQDAARCRTLTELSPLVNHHCGSHLCNLSERDVNRAAGRHLDQLRRGATQLPITRRKSHRLVQGLDGGARWLRATW